jgi:hypothetical protein
MTETRTTSAERFFEHFAGIPLTAECVYYSPQFLDKGIQKEVCDFLLVLRGEAILVSMKSQEDPTKRSGEKLTGWIVKNAERAARQAKGALRNIDLNPFWCQHGRRGRVDFEPRSIKVRHLVVITELFGQTVELPGEFPLEIGDVPVTYLAVNDFLNLVYELRAFADISEYLGARRSLPARTLRTVGDEKPLYSYFILNEGSFAGCGGYEDARITAAAREADLEMHAYFKPVRDRLAGTIECVSDRLATRLENYQEGLAPTLAAFYDDPAARKNYLMMQEELCDLSLGDRQAIGMQLHRVMESVEESDEPVALNYAVGYTDAKPDFLYVLIAAKGIERESLLLHETMLLRAGMAHFRKAGGMAIAERDGVNFEVNLIAGLTPTERDVEAGARYFSHLKISDIQTGRRREEDSAADAGLLWVPPSAQSR